MEERVVNVPLAAGINEDNDVYSVSPPEMLVLKNVSAVKKGALDTRFGFDLVTTGGSTAVEATSYVGTTTGTDVSRFVDAIGGHSTATGDSACLISNGKFYEYVGADQNHGWREVNAVPRFVGTITPAASTGGPILEIESIVLGTRRYTAWVTGLRTGEELSSDFGYKTQQSGDGNSVYYSIQDINTEAYIIPPTRLTGVGGSYVTSAINLRLTTILSNTVDSGTVWPLISWYNITNTRVECALIRPSTGAQVAANQIPYPTYPTTFTSLVLCHRNFDVVGLAYGSSNASRYFVYAFCPPDPAFGLGIRPVVGTATINMSTGVVTLVQSASSFVAYPAGGNGFTPWAARGVVLERNPEVVTSGITFLAKIAIGARVVARSVISYVGQDKLDGQLAVGYVSASGLSVGVVGGKYLPFFGFQTNDNLSSVLSSAAAPWHYSGSPKVISPLKTVVQYSPTTPLPTTPLPQAGPLTGSNLATNRNSEWTIAATVASNSAPYDKQTYFCDLGIGAGTAVEYTLTPRASLPFQQADAAGVDGYDKAFLKVRQKYPLVPHRYPSDAAIDASAIPNAGNQVNLIDIESATQNGSPVAWNNGTFWNVSVIFAGAQIATATVHVANGIIQAVAIQNPLPGVAFTTSWSAAGSITGITFTGGTNGLGGTIGAGTLTGAKAWNISVVDVAMSCSDTPNREQTVTGLNDFYFVGQQEHCVHRWDVARDQASGRVLLLASSTSSISSTNPQGDVPFGAASPHKYNNFCEFYAISIADNYSDYQPLTPLSGGSASDSLRCALGGPWRLVGGLVKNTTTNQWYCAISPSGDDSQCSTYLMRLVYDSPITITVPDPTAVESAGYPSGNNVTYTGNKGMFVEAANMMRVTSPPLNVPQIQLLENLNTLSVGALRKGSASGTQECFSISYDSLSRNWRKMIRMSDYTFINGGVLSMFDGVNCNEHGILVAPQRDLTSISWGDGGAQKMYLSFGQSSYERPFMQVWYSDGSNFKSFYPLSNITRPFWFYEAGMNGGQAYGAQQTKWGGDPTANYEEVFSDGRVQQFTSTAKPNSNGGSAQLGAHYYGRYQNTPTDFSNDNKLPLKTSMVSGAKVTQAYFLWAPRSAKGWSYPDVGTVKGNKESSYSSAETGGNFFMSWCYEYADGTGRMIRSSPSVPTQYTICSEIYSDQPDATSDNGKPRQGGLVTRFKHGFFVPRLELTNRLQSAASDPRSVMLQPYSTIEPYSTVMYRMPFGNFLNPVSDFVVPRNATRGIVPRACVPFSGSTTADNPCGFVISNIARDPSSTSNETYNACFDGSTGEYMGMLREPYLYTTGGVLDNVAPPGCKAMCVHQNRLVIGGADDPTVVWFTKELTPTDSPGFNDLLTLTIEAGGAVTGLASMNSNLIIFKKNDIYIVSGSMPDATGQSSSMSEPTRLPSGIGCVDHRSVLSTPIGVFFRSERSIELLTPDLQVTRIGDKIMDVLTTHPYVTGVAHSAKTQEIYFMLHDYMDDGANTMSARMMVYSYMINAWYEWTIDNLGADMAFVGIVGTTPWVTRARRIGEIVSNVASVYKQSSKYADGLRNASGPTYTYSFYSTQFLTAPFSMNEVQGFQRVKRIRLLLKNLGGSMGGTVFTLNTDTSAIQTTTFTESDMSAINVAQGGTLQLETHVANQKGQYLQLGLQTTAPASVGSATAGYRLSNIALVVGLKQGLNKRITEDAKH